jgi:hypothetical protein
MFGTFPVGHPQGAYNIILKSFVVLMLAPSRQRYHNSNLFYTFINYVLYKYWYTLHEDDPPERVEMCRTPGMLIVNILYWNLVHLLVYSWTA